ncbi:MAG: hypothetical protein HY402_02010 [Elusimicrobia bacterium]|nr:hypothetical protein [Elusimicrobiota bacterium]
MDPYDFSGSLSLNYRALGGRAAEVEVENQLFLSDIFFGVGGPVLSGVPFFLEFSTDSGGRPELYRFLFQYVRWNEFRLQLGKFLVPFGHYNELYRPDMFLTVTRPLLFASPASLDLVSRLNLPRPVFSSGYVDTGVSLEYIPKRNQWWWPARMAAYLVNGLAESPSQGRSFPNPQSLIVPPVPLSGVTVDFGHERNDLADNNDSKTVGTRVEFAIGDLRLPIPLPEGVEALEGVEVGFSAFGSRYDVEDQLDQQAFGADWNFQYGDLAFAGEFAYSPTDFRSPLDTSTTTFTTADLLKNREDNYGFYVQMVFPLGSLLGAGDKLLGVVGLSQMWRRGPEMKLLTDVTIDGEKFESVTAFSASGRKITERIRKLTAAANYRLTDHFILKMEWSLWAMDRFGDVNQGAISTVFSF